MQNINSAVTNVRRRRPNTIPSRERRYRGNACRVELGLIEIVNTAEHVDLRNVLSAAPSRRARVDGTKTAVRKRLVKLDKENGATPLSGVHENARRPRWNKQRRGSVAEDYRRCNGPRERKMDVLRSQLQIALLGV